LGISIAIAGGITMASALVILGVASTALNELGLENEASSVAFKNNDAISKTDIRIFGINATVGSNLVNFTLGNEGIEKVWNYDEFDLYITYDANILGIKTRVTEQLSYNDTAFEVSPAQSLETLDFKIQRNCPIIADGALTVTQTAGIDYETPSGEAFVRIVNTRLTGNGDTNTSGNLQVEDFTAYISTADLSNQIIFTRDDNPGGLNSRVCYEIIEYIGIPGGENSFNVLEQTSVSYAAGSLSVTGPTVNGVTNDKDIVVFITGQAGNEATNRYWNQALSIADWDKDLDQPIFRRGEADQAPNDNDISYAVVEFTGNNWKIQRFEYNHVVPGDDNVQADVTMDGFSGRPLPVNELSKTFLHTQFISDDGPGTGGDFRCGLDDCGANAWLSAADIISFHYDGSIPNLQSMTTVSWIIENIKGSYTVMNVQHLNGLKSGGGEEDVFTNAIPNPVASMSTTSIWGENARSTGSGTAYPRGAIALELTDVDEVTLYRADNGQTQRYRFSVVQYPSSEKCIGGDSGLIQILEWTMSCITYDYLDPGIVNSNEAPEILTKLQHPIFTNGFLQITMSTDNGEVDSQIRTVV